MTNNQRNQLDSDRPSHGKAITLKAPRASKEPRVPVYRKAASTISCGAGPSFASRRAGTCKDNCLPT